MSFIIGANSASGGFSLDNSCRFDDGSTAYLSRTCGSTASSYTVSMWVKTAKSSGSSASGIWWNAATNKLGWELNDFGQIYYYNGSTYRTTAYLRDTSAWYHIVWKVDSGTGTLYVNNASALIAGSPAGIPSLVSGNSLQIGADNGGGTFDGYIAEACFIDGTALNPDQFAESDEDSGIWKPIDVSGLTFGTNGFYLDFKDSAALGNDVSGNGNDLTANNLTAIDQTTDTPTNNGNVHNALIKDTPTLSEGNLNITTSVSATWETATATIGVNTSKWYCEYKVINKGSSAMFGVISMTEVNAVANGKHIGYSGLNSLGYGYNHGGQKYNNDVDASYGDTYTTGDIIGIALDLDNHKLYFSKNGTWQNSGDPESGATGTGSAYDLTTGYDYTFGGSVNSSSDQVSGNFGSPSFSISSGNADGNGYGNFEYSVPSGYLALCTKNLSEVLS